MPAATILTQRTVVTIIGVQDDNYMKTYRDDYVYVNNKKLIIKR